MKLHDISMFVNSLRAYARVRGLGRPAIIASANGFTLAWGDHRREFKFGENWSRDDIDKLIAHLKRW
jgi:hypothetical protein